MCWDPYHYFPPLFFKQISFNIIMVLCSVFSYILNLFIYVQYNILAVKNICK